MIDGDKLAYRCKENGLTLEKLAELAGVSVTTVKNIRNEREQTCDLGSAEHIAKVLGTGVDDLLKKENDDAPDEASGSDGKVIVRSEIKDTRQNLDFLYFVGKQYSEASPRNQLNARSILNIPEPSATGGFHLRG